MTLEAQCPKCGCYDLSQRRGWALPGWRPGTLVQCLRCHWCLQIVFPGLERLMVKRAG